MINKITGKFPDRKSRQSSAELLSACIVVPTYDEANNIKVLLDRIFSSSNNRSCKRNGISLSVLVVDDNSPDGTSKVVLHYKKTNKRVHLLLRKQKNGLGAAYIAGMEYAMRNLKPQVILEMDADLSHDPEDIFRLLMEIKKGADLVIGSRYIDGGSIPAQWGIRRKLISRTANLFARSMLNIHYVQDCTGGFRAIRCSALEKINLQALNVRGYVFQISLLDAILQNNHSVREIPISFNERLSGKSKMELKDIFEVGTFVLKTSFQNKFLSFFGSNKSSALKDSIQKTEI